MFYNSELARFFLKELSWLKNEQWIVVKNFELQNSFWEKEKRASNFFFLRIFTETTKDQPRLALIFTFVVVVSENLTVTKFQFVANKFHSYLVVVVLPTKFEFQKFQITLISSLKALPYFTFEKLHLLKIHNGFDQSWSVHTEEWVCPSSNHIDSVASW